MVSFIKLQLLLRIFLGCYDSFLLSPLNFLQASPKWLLYNILTKKKPCSADIYSSKIIPAFLTSSMSKCVYWGTFLERLGLTPTCRMMVYPIPCAVALKLGCAFSVLADFYPLNSLKNFFGDFLPRYTSAAWFQFGALF